MSTTKPCPWCRQPPSHVSDEGNGWCVACTNKECVVTCCTDTYDTQEEALAAWNGPTAQAGAVAACPFCGKPLKTVSVSEGSTFRWRKVDGCCADGPEVRHDTTADDQAAAELESTRKAIAAWNERPTPPAAVPVEALEGYADKADDLLHKIEGFGKAYPTDIFSEVTDEEREWLHATRRGLMDRIAASMGRHVYEKIAEDVQALRDELTQLIKERSNG